MNRTLSFVLITLLIAGSQAQGAPELSYSGPAKDNFPRTFMNLFINPADVKPLEIQQQNVDALKARLAELGKSTFIADEKARVAKQQDDLLAALNVQLAYAKTNAPKNVDAAKLKADYAAAQTQLSSLQAEISKNNEWRSIVNNLSPPDQMTVNNYSGKEYNVKKATAELKSLEEQLSTNNFDTAFKNFQLTKTIFIRKADSQYEEIRQRLELNMRENGQLTQYQNPFFDQTFKPKQIQFLTSTIANLNNQLKSVTDENLKATLTKQLEQFNKELQMLETKPEDYRLMKILEVRSSYMLLAQQLPAKILEDTVRVGNDLIRFNDDFYKQQVPNQINWAKQTIEKETPLLAAAKDAVTKITTEQANKDKILAQVPLQADLQLQSNPLYIKVGKAVNDFFMNEYAIELQENLTKQIANMPQTKQALIDKINADFVAAEKTNVQNQITAAEKDLADAKRFFGLNEPVPEPPKDLAEAGELINSLKAENAKLTAEVETLKKTQAQFQAQLNDLIQKVAALTPK